MKYSRILVVMLLIICLTSFAFATEQFSIEDKLSPIPTSATKEINNHERESTCPLQGKTVDLSGVGEPADLIVTTKDACECGTSNCQIWVLKKIGTKYKVVMSCVTYSLELMKDKSNGLSKIKTSTGTAGHATIEFWSYNGNEYKKTASYYFAADDKETCKRHPGICPF